MIDCKLLLLLLLLPIALLVGFVLWVLLLSLMGSEGEEVLKREKDWEAKREGWLYKDSICIRLHCSSCSSVGYGTSSYFHGFI